MFCLIFVNKKLLLNETEIVIFFIVDVKALDKIRKMSFFFLIRNSLNSGFILIHLSMENNIKIMKRYGVIDIVTDMIVM